MPKPSKLTEMQRQKLSLLEPVLREAARTGDYEAAERYALDIQGLLRPTGHVNRLMQAKSWLFEAAMESGNLQISESGFEGIRQKTAANSRLYLEATSLLAICYLRQRKLDKAGPLVAKVLASRNIKSPSGRRRFLKHVVSRFEEEGLFGALQLSSSEHLDPGEIQEEAARLIQTKNEDEIFFEMGKSLPPAAVAILLKVDELAKRGLTTTEVHYLPGEAQIMETAELGRTMFRSFQRVLWRSFCDPNSKIYKAWFSQGLSFVLERKYIATAVSTTLLSFGIGDKGPSRVCHRTCH
jgi:hypothetical protein